MSFQTSVKVRFAHVDPAGIVFYPRYFEMLNGVVEDWFAAMEFDFRAMHVLHRIGVPTARLDCEFVKPSMLGDDLNIAIAPSKVGTASCTIDYLVSCEGEVRLTASSVLVCMDLDSKRSVPWPKALAEKMIAAITTSPAYSQ